MQKIRTEIYVADVSAFSDEKLYARLLSLLPEDRRGRLEQYYLEGDRRRGLGAGLLLEYMLRSRGYTLTSEKADGTRVHLAYGEYGKPYIRELEQCYFNLSHAGDYVAAVMAANESGIDIERRRPTKMSLAKRFFTEAEYAYLAAYRERNAADKGACDLAFTRLWTRKESYIKAVGEGMHLPLTDFSVLEDWVEGRRERYLRTWNLPDGYVLSVCTAEPCEEEPVELDLTKVFDGAGRNHYN